MSAEVGRGRGRMMKGGERRAADEWDIIYLIIMVSVS